MARAEGLDFFGQPELREFNGNRDTQFTRKRMVGRVRLDETAGRVKDRPGGDLGPQAGFGQLESAGRSSRERNAQFRFKIRQSLRQDGNGKIQSLCDPPDGAGIRDRCEIDEPPEGLMGDQV